MVTESEINRPFRLKPVGKDYLWGGSRLNDDFAKNINMYPLAETWECSTHPDGLSVVGGGIFEGMTLKEVLLSHPEFMGSHPRTQGELPIMIKLIDAKQDLSVQVHPTDEFANEYEDGQLGKTEMWYVLDASSDAKLVYGLNKTLPKDTVKKAINEGKFEQYLQKIPVHKNDVFFIRAGMIHAIGAGTLIAEIQESSNLTYRLYDYDRVDKNGHKRTLHIDKAILAGDFNSTEKPKQPMRVLRYAPGIARELLCTCKYFEIYRILLNTERCRNMADYMGDKLSFRILLCVAGCGMVQCTDGARFSFFKGDCIFIPATCGSLKIHGKATFLDVRC